MNRVKIGLVMCLMIVTSAVAANNNKCYVIYSIELWDNTACAMQWSVPVYVCINNCVRYNFGAEECYSCINGCPSGLEFPCNCTTRGNSAPANKQTAGCIGEGFDNDPGAECDCSDNVQTNPTPISKGCPKLGFTGDQIACNQ